MASSQQPAKAGVSSAATGLVEGPTSTARPRSRLHSLVYRVLFVGTCLISIRNVVHFCREDASVRTGSDRQANDSAVSTEDLFLTIPSPDGIRAAHRLFSSAPHVAGTPQDKATAHAFLQLLQRELGAHAPSEPVLPAGSPASQAATLGATALDAPQAWIDEYYPALNAPGERRLQLLEPDGRVVWEAELEEPADPEDPDAGRYATATPAWHALSADGDVRGGLVFANYGRKDDYDALDERGVNLTGKIVLARYWANFRGLKVKGAQDRGAAGVLTYTDPRDDGTVTPAHGYAPYPHGPARNPASVQRGSVQLLSVYPGDPSTPGYPAYANATRVANAPSRPRIPSLPISWKNAEVLLKEVSTGGGEGRTVRLVNRVHEQITPIWNVYGVIPGTIMKDEVVVIGNHRDAWVLGATDPSSGTAAVHEVVRGLGALLRTGWKPQRTIMIASWDAEEYGLIGSTEWGEDFPGWIAAHVVAYVNIDSAAAGSRLRSAASPSLAHLVKATAERVPHPKREGATLWDARLDRGPLVGPHGNGEDVKPEWVHSVEKGGEAKRVPTANDVSTVRPLGSGSDFTVFLQRIGVACTNGGFSPTLTDPVFPYHSVFDSIRYQERWGDPGFMKHVAIAKHLGLQVLRLADSIILPLNTTHYAHELDVYADKVETLARDAGLPVALDALRESFKALQSASAALDNEKEDAEAVLRALLHDGEGVPPRGPGGLAWRAALRRVQQANTKLGAFERGFIDDAGLDGREWYRHLGVAPGRWLGYGATTLPGITEALKFDRNASRAGEEIERVKALVGHLARRIAPR